MRKTFYSKIALAIVLAFLAGVAGWSAEEGQVALGGYCPVAYVAMNKAVKGKAEFATEHQGRVYRFANADAKAMFEKEPEKYVPAYDGFCATALAQGKKLESNPKFFTVHNGRTYLFSSKQAKAMFDENPEPIVRQADQHWAALRSAH